MRALFVVLAVLLPLSLSAQADEAPDPVFSLIAERLGVMKPVAAWKEARGVPVEDLDREAVVLGKATQSAADSGLDPDAARAFFQAQILAAKDIQTCWIEMWESGAAASPEKTPDLKEEIRPELIRLGAAILSEIAQALREGRVFDAAGGQVFAEEVAVDCLSPEARDGIYAALSGLRLSAAND